MYTFVTVLIMIACILLVLIVLVQNSKGGGLASNFASSNQMMGVRKTTDFLEKATWTLSAAVLILAFVSVAVIPKNEMGKGSVIDEQIMNVTQPVTTMPSLPIAGDEAVEVPAEEVPALEVEE
ncbi:MAG TPA: preprotein translocase subunit SecG [Marinilabiliaceae bacterium]|nr:preprotein translocase subunit SecG [Marinilabiliaceae bacterium]